MSDTSPHIGTLGEKHLHASLKRWYSRPGDRIEVPVDGFVIDLVRGDLLIEIQTRGFSSMKKKVISLLDGGHRIRIVHPIAVDRWIVKVDPDGAAISRRRSPKHGAVTDVFTELVSFPELMGRPRLGVEVVLTVEEELRSHSPDRAWRRRGWVVVERRLVDVTDTLLLEHTDDLAALLPVGLPETFTTTDIADSLGRSRRTAQQMAYCLRRTDSIVAVGKRGNAIEYRTT